MPQEGLEPPQAVPKTAVLSITLSGQCRATYENRTHSAKWLCLTKTAQSHYAKVAFNHALRGTRTPIIQLCASRLEGGASTRAKNYLFHLNYIKIQY